MISIFCRRKKFASVEYGATAFVRQIESFGKKKNENQWLLLEKPPSGLQLMIPAV